MPEEKPPSIDENPTTLQLVERALSTQGRPVTIAAQLEPAEQEAIVATLDASHMATVATAEACRVAMAAFYERNKATSEDTDAPKANFGQRKDVRPDTDKS